jgi:hypothetical protein
MNGCNCDLADDRSDYSEIARAEWKRPEFRVIHAGEAQGAADTPSGDSSTTFS